MYILEDTDASGTLHKLCHWLKGVFFNAIELSVHRISFDCMRFSFPLHIHCTIISSHYNREQMPGKFEIAIKSALRIMY